MVRLVGKSKVAALIRGGDALPHSRNQRERRASDHAKELSFQITDAAAPPQPNFNVLYVQTPRIGVLQAPVFRAFAATCQEAVDLVKPIFRLGLRETSLFDKCPYYDPEFHKGPSGHLLAMRRTRELTAAMDSGALWQECHKPIPKGRVYISDFPNPFSVLVLNLVGYYLITRQSNRLRGV